MTQPTEPEYPTHYNTADYPAGPPADYPQPRMHTATPAPVPRRRRRWVWPVLCAILVVLGYFLGIATGAAIADAPTAATAAARGTQAPTDTPATAAPSAAATPTPTRSTAPPAVRAPALPTSFSDDGGDLTQEVGHDIAPGTWVIRGAAEGCIYLVERTAGDPSTADYKNTGTGAGSHTVRLRSGTSFESFGCESTWRRTGP